MRQSHLAGHRRHDRIAIKTEERHRGGEHAGALVVALVQKLARRAGDDGMDAAFAEMRRRHHRAQRRFDRAARIGEEIGDAGERLVRLGVEHVQDGADQQRVAGLLPVVSPLQRALGIDQNVGDVLDVADLPLAAADLQQGIVGGARRVGRIEQQHAAEPGAPAGGQRPVLALDVVDDRGAGPGQQRRDDEADAFAGAGRREAQDMLGAVMAKIVVAPSAEQHAVVAEQAGFANFARLGPARRAVGRDALDLSRPPDRHGDRNDDGGDPAGGGDIGALDEDLARIGVVGEPPPEEGRRLIERPAEDLEPRAAELGLERKAPGNPLRRSPDEGEHDEADEEHLAPEDLGRVHGDHR